MTSDFKSIGKYISILYRQAQSYISHQLRPYNIGSGQYTFLLALYRQDGINQEELSQELLIDKATTARALLKLEEEGYVKRERDPVDKRAYRVFITKKAGKVKPVIYQTIRTWSDLLENELNEEEKAVLGTILEKMVNSAKLHLQKNWP